MITTTKLPAGIVFPHTMKSGGEDLVRLIGGYSLSVSCRTSKNIKRKCNEDTFINNRPKKELEMRMSTKTKKLLYQVPKISMHSNQGFIQGGGAAWNSLLT